MRGLYLLTFSGGEVERPALVADADEDEAHALFPDERDGWAPGHRAIGALIDAGAETRRAGLPSVFLGRGTVGWGFEGIDVALAGGLEVEDAAFADVARFATAILGEGLEVHLTDADDLRLAREICAVELAECGPALAVLPDADDDLVRGELDLDWEAPVALGGGLSGQAEDLGLGLIECLAGDAVAQRGGTELSVAKGPAGGKDAILQADRLCVGLGDLRLARGRPREIDVRVGWGRERERCE